VHGTFNEKFAFKPLYALPAWGHLLLFSAV